MLSLYINNQVADLNSDFELRFTQYKTDYTNPTTVKNSFSTSVNLPKTMVNTLIFNNVGRLDRRQTDSFFNPSKKYTFSLLDNGALIQRGYIKVDSITKDNYECTLYGELGNILYFLTYGSDNAVEDEDHKVTLGVLPFETDLNFNITKDFVEAAWNRLDNIDTTSNNIYDTLNFAIAFNGKPDASNFDAGKVWTDTNLQHTSGGVYWGGTYYTDGNFPTSITDSGTLFQTINLWEGAAQEKYALIELGNDATDLETRDLRSYLQRPVLRMKKVIEAIGRYINTNLGYTLETVGDFFTSDDYNKLWFTLNRLDKINEEVESYYYFTQEELLSLTDTPCDYLVSFCKTFGLYIVVDVYRKKLTLYDKKSFFTGENTTLNAEEEDITVEPLSFSVNNYTFDYKEAESVFTKEYKEKYNFQYGSKRVLTGYQFDKSTEKFIENNIFTEAADVIEQSGWYRSGLQNLQYIRSYPKSISAIGVSANYKLFNLDDINNIKEKSGDMYVPGGFLGEDVRPLWGYYGPTKIDSGATITDLKWGGLERNKFKFPFPLLQLHSDDNSPSDGNNVLVWYGGKRQIGIANAISYRADGMPTALSYFARVNWQSYEIDTSFAITDDNTALKKYIDNKNAWIDTKNDSVWVKHIDRLPIFNRSSYRFDSYGVILNECNAINNFRYTEGSGISSERIGGGVCNKVTLPQGGDYNRRYVWADAQNTTGSSSVLITASIYVQSGSISDITKLYPSIIDAEGNETEISSYITTQSYNQWVTIAAIAHMPSYSDPTKECKILPFSTTNREMILDTVIWVRSLNVYNLGTICGPLKAPEYDALTATALCGAVGRNYQITKTLDFGMPRVHFVDGAGYLLDSDLYTNRWSKMITDLYDVNTKIVNTKILLENLDNEIFRKFYIFQGAKFILGEVTEWDPESKIANVKLIKVNNPTSYTT